ncbi:MAG: ATP-binding cassette domain-containing protein [Devosia nanyangense]|uniref:ATP-binding cassette domain-containing protein n=1 Tax=Devosia nanyangense TaxID=1228055 RepID=A0A933NY22_9HYPH|nr:ATP-binding cassette domain-containing protein [Devosia nanyangense]
MGGNGGTPRLGRKGEAQAIDPRSLQPLRRLLPFILRYPWRVGLTIAFLLIAATTSLLIPLFAGKIIDKGFVAQNLGMVASYGWLVLGVVAVMAVASAARFYFVSVLGERVILDLRREVFDRMLSLDQTFFDLHRVGELTSRLNADVATIRNAVGSSLSMTLRGMITIVGAVVLMFLTSFYLALGVVVIVPLIVLPVLLLTRRLRKMSRRTQDALAEMSAMATETLSASKTVKSFVQEPVQSRLYADKSQDSYRAEVTRLGGRAALVGGIMFIVAAALVVMVWWGAKSVFDGAVTTGQLAQFMLYALMATSALTSISEVLGSLQTVAGSTERLIEILDTKPTILSPAQARPMPMPSLGIVAFEDVGFAYETRDNEQILSGLGFAVNKGETVALVGASGAGKSTVFALLQRFYDVTSGRILVDGVDIRNADLADLRRRFAYVEQEPTIFAGTITQNIRFGKPDATDAEIEAAARAALVHDFVTALPNGYASIVGERGVMLSGGQKQRIAIARALLKDAPILLLDEATSALDAESERLVQIALDRLMEGRTTLVIAHRLATIRDADRILVLDKGRLIDQGTHDELVRKGGRYAELARLQFRLEEPRAAE